MSPKTAVPEPFDPGRRVLAARWDDHDTFTVEEAGEILRLSRGSAYSAAASGELPTIRFGRRMVVPRLALERLLTGAAAQTATTRQSPRRENLS
jgi:excisionase family DNA binding protein